MEEERERVRMLREAGHMESWFRTIWEDLEARKETNPRLDPVRGLPRASTKAAMLEGAQLELERRRKRRRGLQKFRRGRISWMD